MRLLALFILQSFFLANACPQKVDSIKYSNGHLYFHEYGKGEPVLLLTSGPGANYQQLEDVAITLGQRHRIILPEQRGTGNSIPQPFDTSTINLTTAQSDIKLLGLLEIEADPFYGALLGRNACNELCFQISFICKVINII